MKRYKTKLKEQRKFCGLSRCFIAKFIDVSVFDYFKYETGREVMPFRPALELAHFYNVSFEYLMECDLKTHLFRLLETSPKEKRQIERWERMERCQEKIKNLFKRKHAPK